MEKIFVIKQDAEKTTIITQKDHLLADDNDRFKSEFDEILPTIGQELVLDFTKVKYVSSLILASLVYILKKLTENKKKLVLANLQPAVKEMLEITNLDKVFDIK